MLYFETGDDDMEHFFFPNSTNYGIFVDNDLCWAEYNEEAKAYEAPVPANIVAALGSVKECFENAFGSAYVEQFRVSVLPSSDNPCVYHRQHIIFLSARGRRWAKYVYQFSHELCHIMMSGDAPAHMRWFEETICELASFFFMDKVSKLWRVNPPYSNWKEYAPNFILYVDNAMKTATRVPLEDTFSSFIEKLLPILSADPYRRDVNCLCAIRMLPIFENNPMLWRDVHDICKIPADLSFIESLEYWKNAALNKRAIDEIIHLFTEPQGIPSHP